MNVANDKGLENSTIVIEAPAAGVRVAVAVAAGATIQFDFPLDDITFSILDGGVLLARADGGEIVLEGLVDAETWQEPPRFLLPDGINLPLEELLTVSIMEGQLTEALDKVGGASMNEFETTAGEATPARGGASPIVPESGLVALDALAETDLDASDPRRFEHGEPPELQPIIEDSAVAAENVLKPLGEPLLSVSRTSGAEDAAIALSIEVCGVGGDGTQTLSIAIGGLPAGAALSAGQDNGDGSWALTPADLDGLTIRATSHSAEDFELTVTAVATQNDGTSKSSSAPAVVIVNAVADAPELAVEDSTARAEDLVLTGPSGADTLDARHGSDTIIAARGDDVMEADLGANTVTAALNISATLNDTDGSESLSLLVSDVPAGGVLSAGHQVSNSTWILTPADIAGLTITVPADTSSFVLTITAASSDVDPDSGLSDSTASMATIKVAVEAPVIED